MLNILGKTSITHLGSDGEVRPFEPHPWLRSGHAQTLAGWFLPSGNLRLRASTHVVELADGDRLSVLESLPACWREPMPAAVLVNGLAGCAQSPYVIRFGQRLMRLGIRVVRMNLRGAGSSFGLARGIYHAGRSDDLRHVVAWLEHRAPGSPIAVAGFSLGQTWP
jgi:predicted alpha/beta-fold hydrolase